MISKYAEDGKIINCLFACKEMKDNGVIPDIFIYNDLLKAAAKEALHNEADAIMDDMLAFGVRPDRQSFHHLIHVRIPPPFYFQNILPQLPQQQSKRYLETDHMWYILSQMQDLKIPPNAQTLTLILEKPLMVGNLEEAVQFLGEMNLSGVVPELRPVQAIITLAAEFGHSRLALEIANMFEEASVRRLDNEVWVQCLISAAENLYVSPSSLLIRIRTYYVQQADGVSFTWPKVVNELGITPDEGLCIDVLHTAARHGLPDLGTDVLRVLKLIGASWQEHHLASMVEAFCKAGRLQEAFETLHVMRENDIAPVAETAFPIFDIIKKDIDTVDKSWQILDKSREEGKTVDITAINVIIQATVALEDMQRAVGTYKSIPDYGIKPNVETFNLLLSACITVGHRDLGDHLLGEMKNASIKPNSRTYERLIILCLTQTDYEDAFFYLEEMKGHKLLPTISIYDAIIRKCVMVGDSRYRLALEEMVQCGYPVSQMLNDFISNGGQPPNNESELGGNGPDFVEKKADIASHQ